MTIANKEKNSDISILIGYLVLFYFVWTMRELWLIEYINSFGEIVTPLLKALVKSLVWIVPVVVYIKYYLHLNPISYLKLNVNVKKGFVWGSVLFGLCLLLEAYLLNDGSFRFSLSFNHYLNTILMAGLAEEIVFRGFILQELNKRFAFWKANVMTAFLFLVIHYPIWIYIDVIFQFTSHIYVFLIGLFFGFVFKKTGSLWSVILLHAFHNYLSLI